MIYGKLDNHELDFLQGERFRKAIEYIQNNRDCFPQPGEYEIDGRHVYAKVQAYDTQEMSEIKWEGHHQYVDIQYIVSGEEVDLVAEVPQTVTEYNDERDLFSGETEDFLEIPLTPGYFAVFFPSDFHKPKCHHNGLHKVQKILIKVEI